MRKYLTLLLALVVVTGCAMVSLGVSAIQPITPDTPVSLTLTYSYNDTAFEGLEINIYRVAEVFPNSSFGLAGDFVDYSLALNSVKSQSEWKQIAETAMAYAVADGISPTASSVTDEEGKADFDSLETGLYLVAGCRVDHDKGYCSFDSFMLILPAANDDGTWSYDVNAKPKSSYVQTVPDDVEYSVIKLWKDTGYENARPASVKIELYKDGTFVESVTLSAENNWSYSWQAPGDGAVWTAVEADVENGYTVTVEQKENSFVVTNTYSKDPPPPPTGDTTNIGLYIIIMAIAGMGLVTIGAISRRRG